MNFMAILDLVIGLIFIYFLISLLCSTVQELISNLIDIRAKDLEGWMKDTFNKDDFGKKLLQHKLIDGLTAKGNRTSYIPSDTFVHALLDSINKSDQPYTIESLNSSILTSNLPEDLKRRIMQSIAEAQGNIQLVRKDIETWFNQAMERVSGTYKKFAQKVILITSLLVVGFLNVDTINIIQYLYNHPEKSQALANHISEVVEKGELQIPASADTVKATQEKIKKDIDDLSKLKSELDNTKIPMGWEGQKSLEGFGIISKIIGLLMTAFAAAIGAPFWFDLLNKLVNLRSAGRRLSTTTDEEKKKEEKK